MLRTPILLLAAMLVLAGSFFLFRTSPAAAVHFGSASLNLEYATTEAAREKGLGDRTSLPANAGMLFVFPKPDYYGFWMKDTLIPLDMFWLDDKGQVVSMALDVATSSFPDVFYPTAPALYVLETNAGFAAAHGIATGTPLLLRNFPHVSK